VSKSTKSPDTSGTGHLELDSERDSLDLSKFDVEISGQTFKPVPESWVSHGSHEQPGSGYPRYFATLVTRAGGRLIVRYAHPVNSGILTVEYDILELDSGAVPLALASGSEEFLNSTVANPFDRPQQNGSVRLHEREVMWALHGEWLRENTAFEPEGDR
jgi:hypothetical protein